MVYTFYSFKGGVGRSMALANIAELFYDRGLRVLIIDFDLEAPGLERFFDHSGLTLVEARNHRGIIDLLDAYVENSDLVPLVPPKAVGTQTPALLAVPPLTAYRITIHDGHPDGRSLHLITAGE